MPYEEYLDVINRADAKGYEAALRAVEKLFSCSHNEFRSTYDDELIEQESPQRPTTMLKILRWIADARDVEINEAELLAHKELEEREKAGQYE